MALIAEYQFVATVEVFDGCRTRSWRENCWARDDSEAAESIQNRVWAQYPHAVVTVSHVGRIYSGVAVAVVS